MFETIFITEISNESNRDTNQKTLGSIVVTMIANISISKLSICCHFIEQQCAKGSVKVVFKIVCDTGMGRGCPGSVKCI